MDDTSEVKKPKEQILKRNPKLIKSYLVETKSKQVIVKKPLILQFPKRYEERNMAEIGFNNYVFTIYALIDEQGNYAISSAIAMMKTNPNRVSEQQIGEELYYNFHYDVGDVLIDNTELIQKDTQVYSVMDEFFLKGNVPWFIEYEDLGKIFNKAKKYSGSDVAKNLAVLEGLAAFVSRQQKDKTKMYRHNPVDKPYFISLFGNVYFAAPTTINKLVGNYFQEGVISALVQPSEKSSHIEDLLRN